MQEWKVIANEPWVWICGWILVAIALFQCTYFAKKAFNVARHFGFSRKDLLGIIRGSIITAFGPVCAEIFVMIALVMALSPGFAFQREGAAVGSVFTELVQASNAAVGAGQEFPNVDLVGFANVVFVMNVSCIGWLIVAGLFTPYLGKIREKMAGGDPKWLSVLTICSTLGVFGYWAAVRLMKLGGSAVATISGMLIAAFLFKLADVIKKPRLKEWALGIAMFLGMFLGKFYAG
ncbi:MAG: DUF5058 family protein [Candidatus Freyarchaeota archaeon]